MEGALQTGPRAGFGAGGDAGRCPWAQCHPQGSCWRQEEVRAESRCEVRGQGQRRNMLPAQRWRKGRSRGLQAPPELGARAAHCPENLLDLRLTRPVTEALRSRGLLSWLRHARAAPFGPSPLPTQVRGLLRREMDHEGWRREGGLCPEAQKRPARTPPLTAPQEGTPRLRLPEPQLLPHLVGSRRFQGEGVSPGEAEGGRQGGAPGGLGAGVPCPPSRPCAGSPPCCWDANVRTPLEDPQCRGRGWGGPSHGPQSASPASGSWFPPCPPAKAREGWSHGHPSPAVSPEPRTGLAQTEKQGCL